MQARAAPVYGDGECDGAAIVQLVCCRDCAHLGQAAAEAEVTQHLTHSILWQQQQQQRSCFIRRYCKVSKSCVHKLS
jgi:hypothetical protein